MKFFLLFSLTWCASTALKFLVMNDIHLNVTATAEIPMVGNETSIGLFQVMLDDMKAQESGSGIQIDAILIPGDFCAHGMAANTEQLGTPSTWNAQLQTINMVITMIQTTFPGIPILPSIGNNDVQYHNQAPTYVQAPSYYADLWDSWFTSVPANANFTSNSTIEASFLKGGYYAVDLGDDLVLLVLNGMYPFFSNHQALTPPLDMALEMLDWVNTTLAANPTKKFVTMAHVYYGNNFFESLQMMWYKNYTDIMLYTLQANQANHVLSMGAHIHRLSVFSAKSTLTPDLAIVQVVTPAISPIYNNNPGYGVLMYDEQDKIIESYNFRFLQIADYYRIGTLNFQDLNVEDDFGLDLNVPGSVRDFHDLLLTNQQEWAKYEAHSMGLTNYLAQGSQLIIPFINNSNAGFETQTTQICMYCAATYFTYTDFSEWCVSACGPFKNP